MGKIDPDIEKQREMEIDQIIAPFVKLILHNPHYLGDLAQGGSTTKKCN